MAPSRGQQLLRTETSLLLALVMIVTRSSRSERPVTMDGQESLEQVGVRAALPPLDLEQFEDADCLEIPEADALLTWMHDLITIAEEILLSDEREQMWKAFDLWASENVRAAEVIAVRIISQPYCEPVKIAWMATECLLLLRQGPAGANEALNCAAMLDEDFFAAMTPRGSKFATRLHLVLKSPWPALRTLDLIVRLHPETTSTRMGACKAYRNWRDDPDVFDWPSLRPLVNTVADSVTADPSFFDLKPQDGPLSAQYRARWLRVHRGVPALKEAIAFSDDVFDRYREHHYKAGCHLGVISSYVLQLLLIHMRDVEGRLQRYTASVAQLVNLHAQFTYIVRTDWPLFRLLHIASLLQRSPPKDALRVNNQSRGPKNAARTLCERVVDAVVSEDTRKEQEHTAPSTTPIAFVTAAWGHLAPFATSVLDRWEALMGLSAKDQTTPRGGTVAPLLFLAMDDEASQRCSEAMVHAQTSLATEADLSTQAAVRCIEAPRRLGVEAAVAKYLSLAALTQIGVTAVWLDLDIYVLHDPIPLIESALGANPSTHICFARHLASDSISPAVVVSRGGSEEAVDVLMRYASWLNENPYLLDHQGWDQFFENREGDFSGGFDYQGRNVTPVKNDTGPQTSFVPPAGLAPPDVRYAFLGNGFGSGNGWRGNAFDELILFHFWGANQSQEKLFDVFYPHMLPGSAEAASNLAARYRRVLTSNPTLSAFVSEPPGRSLYVVEISYADGCCKKSLELNRQKALAAGVDEARAYGRRDLDPVWAARHHKILSQRRGGGWWLWKPHVILRTLLDPAVPWHRGIVVWVDAGNHLIADPRALINSAMADSDVTALRLKWCLERDWTDATSLRRLNASERYAIVDRPQIGAYLLLFRKTEIAISFVTDWLRKAEDPESLIGTAATEVPGVGVNHQKYGGSELEVPGFQKHQADQSVFSVLFKDRGFHAVSLEEGHKYVKLARWRE